MDAENGAAMSDDVTQSLELMRRAQDGDDDALNRLIERYYGRVRPIVRARLSRRLRARVDSGDILQQVFATMFRTYDRFEVKDEASLIGWLARIAERKIHDELDRHSAGKRSTNREVNLDGPAESSPRIDVPAGGRTPSEELQAHDDQERLDECLAELPELYRELILLRDYAGMSWDQVAEETERPSAAAARMMHAQALIELGKCVRRS